MVAENHWLSARAATAVFAGRYPVALTARLQISGLRIHHQAQWARPGAVFRRAALAFLLLLAGTAYGQTGCAVAHKETGAFICYPNPTEHAGDATVPQVFHLSAQGNAPAGQKVRHYVVLIDGARLFETRLAVPLHRISIEINLRSPFLSGRHNVTLYIDRAGTAKVNDIAFRPVPQVGFCDPFSRMDPRNCVMTRLRGPLNWSLTPISADTHISRDVDPSGAQGDLADFVRLHSRNLQSLEADVADASAVDTVGDLFTASHSFGDIEIKKYSRNGSLVADTMIRSHQPGFVAITALAVDDAGNAWIAGNTTALFSTTPNALSAPAGKPAEPRAFVMRINANHQGAAPAYLTYLADARSRVHAIRVDRDGNVYLAGTTSSIEFPHQASFGVSTTHAGKENTVGFVSTLDPSGSALLWSTLLPGADLYALTRDSSNTVYVTGRSQWQQRPGASNDILIAALSDNGRKPKFIAHLRGSGYGQAIAVSSGSTQSWVLVAGAMQSTRKRDSTLQSFAIALQPCRSSPVYLSELPSAIASSSPEIAIHSALDAFASVPSLFAAGTFSQRVSTSQLAIQIAPACSSSHP